MLIISYSIPLNTCIMRNNLLFLIFTLTATSAYAEEFDGTVPMRERATSTYYVEARINGHAMEEFMVDTGSSYVTINEKTLGLLMEEGDVEYLRNLSGILADGSSMSVPIYRVATVNLGHCVIEDVEVAVFPRSNRHILGLSALRKVAPFAVTLEPPALKFSNCQLDRSNPVAGTPPNPGNDMVGSSSAPLAPKQSEHSAFFTSGNNP